MPIPRYSRIAYATGLPCRSALLCSGMTLVAWPGKHNEPGFAGGGVQYDYLIDLVTRFINWQMIGAILFY